jgi:hypothetical protein
MGDAVQRTHSWDPDAEVEFDTWATTTAKESELDAVCTLLATLDAGYLRLGPIENKQSQSAQRRDGKAVEIYGHTAARSIHLFVGVCDESDEVRTVLLGPCKRQVGWTIARQRIERW